jgi:hypothetical protein
VPEVSSTEYGGGSWRRASTSAALIAYFERLDSDEDRVAAQHVCYATAPYVDGAGRDSKGSFDNIAKTGTDRRGNALEVFT